jgi:uncharacterized phage protein (predicted DNA packaging)
MVVTLDQLKQSLRIDGAADDTLLSVYLSSAQKNLARPIGCEVNDDFLADNPEYDTAVLMLAGHYWTHRLGVSDVNLTEIPAGVDSLYWPLKLEYAIKKEAAENGSDP